MTSFASRPAAQPATRSRSGADLGMPWLRGELREASSRVARLLRAAPDRRAAVPGLAWSVGELGAHLVSVPSRYRRMLAGGVPFPASLATLNEEELRAVGVTDLRELAVMVQAEVDRLLDALGGDGDAPVPFFGMRHTAAGVAGAMLGELLVHGLDLARSIGRPWSIRADQAVAVTRGVLPPLPFVVSQAPARAHGSYHLHLRGGDDWAIRVSGDGIAVDRSRPARADVHVSAEPVTNLLVGYRRIPRWRAAVIGRVVVWGRRPWLAPRLGTLMEAP